MSEKVRIRSTNDAAMRTRALRMQLVIRFAQIDLDALHEEDWYILQHELWWFLTIGTQEYDRQSRSMQPSKGDILAFPHPPLGYPLSKDDLRTIQKDTRVILDELLKSQEGPLRPPCVASLNIQMSLQGISERSKDGSFLVIYGPPCDIFLATFLLLLNREPLRCIQRCPECQTIFYRIRKQKYCTHVCANRVSVRNWRQTPKRKQAETERAHQRYVTKKKPAHVTRRARKERASQADTPPTETSAGEDPTPSVGGVEAPNPANTYDTSMHH